MLITTLMVVFLLAVISVGLMGITYVNMRSAEREYSAIRARVAAQSVLSALGDRAETEIRANNGALWGVTSEDLAQGSFTDDDFVFEVTVSEGDERLLYVLTCEARRDLPNAPVVRERLEIAYRPEQPLSEDQIQRIWGDL